MHIRVRISLRLKALLICLRIRPMLIVVVSSPQNAFLQNRESESSGSPREPFHPT
ncbi:unnamed protein product [Dibothriocephalus latus]|uniref:Uncharacterized protein n=1 Tax=Dibothriocephalus latus TaxID=60516 RepID=A0A3P7PCH8_DIBLA|nr:unnamed protein product [Dibothriocephalus latus]